MWIQWILIRIRIWNTGSSVPDPVTDSIDPGESVADSSDPGGDE